MIKVRTSLLLFIALNKQPKFENKLGESKHHSAKAQTNANSVFWPRGKCGTRGPGPFLHWMQSLPQNSHHSPLSFHRSYRTSAP